jgi:alginate export protein
LTAGRHYAQVKYHLFQLDQPRDSWKDEAGVTVLGSDPTGQSGTSLGREVDLNWRFAWKEKTSFEAGYARFMPDRFARLTRGNDASDWAYVMLTATF